MNGKILLIGGGALALYLISRAKAIKETVKFLEYTPGDVSLKFEGLTPIINIRLDIYNPNRTSVPVNGVLGRIFFKGKSVASFTNADKVIINGNESTSVNVKVRLSLFNAAVALLTKDPSRKLEIDGLIKTSVTDIPFGYSYDLNSKAFQKKNYEVSGWLSRSGRITRQVPRTKRLRFIDAFSSHKQTA